MTQFVTTPDGAQIAYERHGEGPPVILVSGAFGYRALTPHLPELGAALAERGVSLVAYDRPGRGESRAEPPHTLDGDLAALAALIEEIGGSATLLGASSGAVIALAAAARGLPLDALVLWEPPLGMELGADAAQKDAELREVAARGDDDATARAFLSLHLPPEWLEQATAGPQWPLQASTAQSLLVDTEVVTWAQSAPHDELFGGVSVPTLVLVGEETLPLMEPAAQSIVRTIPHATLRRLPVSALHAWDPDALVDAVATVVGDARPERR